MHRLWWLLALTLVLGCEREAPSNWRIDYRARGGIAGEVPKRTVFVTSDSVIGRPARASRWGKEPGCAGARLSGYELNKLKDLILAIPSDIPYQSFLQMGFGSDTAEYRVSVNTPEGRRSFEFDSHAYTTYKGTNETLVAVPPWMRDLVESMKVLAERVEDCPVEVN